MITAYNYALSLSALSWAALRIFKIPNDERFTLVNVSIIAFHLQIAYLFFARTPITNRIPLRVLGIGILSLAAGGMILKIAPPLNHWPVVNSFCFLISTTWVVFSFAFLGKSFAVLPVARELVVRGPYSLVRHPAYLGELGMLTSAASAAFLANPVFALLFFGMAVVAIAWRINEEESVLTSGLEYDAYRSKVTYRLLPFVW